MVRQGRARKALDERIAIENSGIGWGNGRLDDVAHHHVGGDAECIVLERDPVEAGIAVEVVFALRADEDVIAALAEHLIETTAADEDVMASYDHPH